ncbi:MAG: DUF1232 domain-containing protein [Lysobacterales bacterium]|jgi:uncharacterized membrane protein YkvA (DUF1232 family)|nr:MAG: DUF1232 domain-containing protein [Xanthomonadales bacterium]RPI00093.1 MAG: DUF1232 domain-containing protein [Xanthomonadales bacterium]
MEITFELSEEDLGFFREVMLKSRQRTGGLDENAVVENARQLLQRIARSDTSDFIRERMSRLETLIGMLVDKGWGMEDEDRGRVLQALAYFSDPEDLVPDDVPGLGFLDDAIMIELVCRELRHEIQAYRDFCADRAAEPGRLGEEALPLERSDWLEERRQQLHSRMRRRRRQGKSGGGHSPFSLF